MMTVTIKKIGGSMGIVIPKSVASDMGLTEGAALDISVRNGVIVMPRPGRRARRPLKTLAGQMNRAAYRKHNRELSARSGSRCRRDTCPNPA
jgi:AbrB family looped-hinge helix DNA binding protein